MDSFFFLISPCSISHHNSLISIYSFLASIRLNSPCAVAHNPSIRIDCALNSILLKVFIFLFKCHSASTHYKPLICIHCSLATIRLVASFLLTTIAEFWLVCGTVALALSSIPLVHSGRQIFSSRWRMSFQGRGRHSRLVCDISFRTANNLRVTATCHVPPFDKSLRAQTPMHL